MSTPIRPDTDRGPNYSPSSDGAGQPAEKPSLVDDFLEIFYAPSRVFARHEKGGYGIALLIVSAVAGLFAFASRSATSAIFDAEFARGAQRAMAQNPRITEEMMNQQRGIMEGVTMFFTYVGTPVLIFLVALLVWIAARIVSAKITYAQAALITTFAWIPRLLGSLLTTVQALVMDPGSFNGMFSVSYSPARFLDPSTTNPMLMGALGRLDVFTIWITVLMGIGIAVIGKQSRARGYAAAAIIWVIGTLPMLRPQ